MTQKSISFEDVNLEFLYVGEFFWASYSTDSLYFPNDIRCLRFFEC